MVANAAGPFTPVEGVPGAEDFAGALWAQAKASGRTKAMAMRFMGSPSTSGK
jgi:hypothetical protein